MISTNGLLLSLLLTASLLFGACMADEAGGSSNPFNSDVTPSGDDKADEAAAVTGFVVLEENDAFPGGRVPVYNIDGLQIAEINVDEYQTQAEEGRGSLFASPVFSPADGREILSEEGEGGSFAPEETIIDGSELPSATGELNPFHCNTTGLLRPIPGRPPCNAVARWVTPRTFSGPPKNYAYLLYRFEHIETGASDEYPYAERTWWGWGGTVELHKAALLWDAQGNSFVKTRVSVPIGSRFEFEEDRLIRSNAFEVNGDLTVAVFLRLPLVLTE